eukprot:m.146341 g.146341  ORF g.146341 m.146341 type:complete len:1110 (-) comp14968_c0_seq2:269-3598(-)
MDKGIMLILALSTLSLTLGDIRDAKLSNCSDSTTWSSRQNERNRTVFTTESYGLVPLTDYNYKSLYFVELINSDLVINNEWEKRPIGTLYQIFNYATKLCLSAPSDHSYTMLENCSNAQLWDLRSNQLKLPGSEGQEGDKCLTLNNGIHTSFRDICDGCRFDCKLQLSCLVKASQRYQVKESSILPNATPYPPVTHTSSHITQHFFPEGSQIDTLKFDANIISGIDDRSFDGLKIKNKLSFYDKPLAFNLTEDTFAGIYFLPGGQLDLSRCKLTQLPIFPNMGKLTTLKLGCNKLTMLHPESLFLLTSLESLDLSGNSIKLLQPNVFNLPGLKNVNLNGNPLRKVSKDAYPDRGVNPLCKNTNQSLLQICWNGAPSACRGSPPSCKDLYCTTCKSSALRLYDERNRTVCYDKQSDEYVEPLDQVLNQNISWSSFGWKQSYEMLQEFAYTIKPKTMANTLKNQISKQISEYNAKHNDFELWFPRRSEEINIHFNIESENKTCGSAKSIAAMLDDSTVLLNPACLGRYHVTFTVKDLIEEQLKKHSQRIYADFFSIVPKKEIEVSRYWQPESDFTDPCFKPILAINETCQSHDVPWSKRKLLNHVAYDEYDQVHYRTRLIGNTSTNSVFFINPRSGAMYLSPAEADAYTTIHLCIEAVDISGLSTVIKEINFTVLPKDTDVEEYGPYGKGCAQGHAVDLVLFDESYTCSCRFGFFGANCDKNMYSFIGGGIGGIVFLFLLYKYYMSLTRAAAFQRDLNVLREELNLQKMDKPRELSKYQYDIKILETIGRGSFGEVSKALFSGPNLLFHSTGVLVAVKRGTDDPKNLIREAAIMAVIKNHDNVVSLIGVVTTTNPYLLVMTYCEKGSLLKVMRKAEPPLDIHRRAKCLQDTCQGMVFLAKKQFVHRDLACRNILVDSADVCKVADFGMSQAMISRSAGVDKSGHHYFQAKYGENNVNPIRWTAPEVFLKNRFSEASDVWSFGIVLWEITSDGQRPYADIPCSQVIERVSQGHRLLQPSNCSRELWELAKQCWHEDPARRPTFSKIEDDVCFLSWNGKELDLKKLDATETPDFMDYASMTRAEVSNNYLSESDQARLIGNQNAGNQNADTQV